MRMSNGTSKRVRAVFVAAGAALVTIAAGPLASVEAHRRPVAPIVWEAPVVPEPAEAVEPAVLRVAPPPSLEDEMARFSRIVDKASRAHGVDRALVQALILVESGYDPEAVSASGALGLMQLMPATAARYGVADPFDPEMNVRGGVKYLRDLLALYDGDIELALAAYNAGPGNVARAGNRIPSNPETERFVPKVMGYYRHLQARHGPPAGTGA